MPADNPDVPALILASRSPRRLALLAQIGITPASVVPADVDEGPRRRETPAQHALRLAEAKARRAVALVGGAGGVAGTLVLGTDTVVACGRRILPKAEDESQARTCLSLVSGRRHRVLGGICVIAPDGPRPSTARGDQGRVQAPRGAGNRTLSRMRGVARKGRRLRHPGPGRGVRRPRQWSYSNVVGLPLFETATLLRGLGLRT